MFFAGHMGADLANKLLAALQKDDEMKTIQERLRDGADTCHARNIQLDYARVATKAADRIDALESEVAALTKDAERYQWLRLYGYVDSMKMLPRTDPLQTDMFDLAIDAAIAAQKEQV